MGMKLCSALRPQATSPLSPPELLQTNAAQEKEQREDMGQTLKKLEDLAKQALERIPELRRLVGDW